jgi:hypothetical protein
MRTKLEATRSPRNQLAYKLYWQRFIHRSPSIASEVELPGQRPLTVEFPQGSKDGRLHACDLLALAKRLDVVSEDL